MSPSDHVLFEIENHSMLVDPSLSATHQIIVSFHAVCTAKRYILDDFIVMLWTLDVQYENQKVFLGEARVMRIVVIFITALSI